MPDMKRREFIALIGGGGLLLAAKVSRARGQQPAMPVVGFLHLGSPEPVGPNVAAFRQGMNETGFVDGRDVAIEYRWAQGQYDRLPALAADLVRRQVTVIAACATSAPGLAAKAATSAIPIVFQTGGDPVQDGLVTSMNRPGRNVTGVSRLSVTLEPKRLELLRETLTQNDRDRPSRKSDQPTFRTGDPAVGGTSPRARAQAPGAQSNQRRRVGHRVRELSATGGRRSVGSPRTRLQPLAQTNHRTRVGPCDPNTMYATRDFVVAGGLVSYDASGIDSFRQVGVYVGRILKGEKPADLPVMQPTKFELVINLKTARTLGLTIPDKLLALADEVIE